LVTWWFNGYILGTSGILWLGGVLGLVMRFRRVLGLVVLFLLGVILAWIMGFLYWAFWGL
jgi:hypothetical protein